jgi:predicted lipid-binding transport protein (Tim44 family)
MRAIKVGVIGMALALALALSVGGPAYGRAGGGESFSDSGSSSSSSSGGGGWDSGSGSHSGGGGGNVAFWILFSALPWPVKAVLVIIIIVVAANSKRRASARRAGGVSSSPVAYSPPPAAVFSAPPPMFVPNVAEQLAEIKGRDPGFSEQQFKDMASTSFFKIQEAWSKRNLSIATAFMSPALLQRFTGQIEELKKQGRTNKIETLVVGGIELVEAAHDGGFDYVTARIKASAADYTVDDKTGELVSGARKINGFTEYWTFMRSDRVKTPEKGQEAEAKSCPKCGAPIALNAVGKCEYCGSDITSGEFTWVLSEIVQESVWRPRAQAARPASVSPLAGGRYVLGLVQCPRCGANVQDIAGVTKERCWRCGASVPTAQ